MRCIRTQEQQSGAVRDFRKRQADAEDHLIGAGSLTRRLTPMLAHCDLIAFIATAQAEEARRFYSEVLGLRLIEDSPFALVFDANGTMLRIQRIETLNPAGYKTLGWQVGDIQEVVGLLRKRGILCERYPGRPQD